MKGEKSVNTYIFLEGNPRGKDISVTWPDSAELSKLTEKKEETGSQTVTTHFKKDVEKLPRDGYI